MNQTEATTKNLRSIAKDVSERLQSKFDDLRRMIAQLKEHYVTKARANAEEQSRLLNTLEEANRFGQNTTNKKSLLRSSLDKEEFDLEKIEKEAQELQDTLTELECVNKILLEKRIDAEEKIRNLNIKCRQLQERTESKFKEQKGANDIFKTYIGLDIVRLKENIIKMVFNNLGMECYVIIDFGLDECVSECQPELNLEKLNYAFKEKKSFYEFVKYAREQLKQRI